MSGSWTEPGKKRYLVRYGHLDDKLDARKVILFRKLNQQPNMAETRDFLPYTDDEISNGIKSFQNSFGLEVSGDLNEETIKLMDSPRCGISDINRSPTNSFQLSIHLHRHRSRRYTIKHKTTSGKMVTLKWNKKHLTWNIFRYFAHLPNKVQDDNIGEAFKMWEYTSSFKFTRTSSTKADILIQFASGNHGDKSNFDGKDGILAHAYYPFGGSLAGDIHFDAAEKWNDDYDLFSVALHEIGHSLGLGHSKTPRSIMYATYKKKTALEWDDRWGIDKLYGPCETKVDAAIYQFGDVYLFRKDMIWKVDEFDMYNTFDQGFPKKSKDEIHPKIPNDIDAALYWSDYFLYVLKGTRSYGYDRYSKELKYDNTIAYDWPGIPNSPDASLCYTSEKVTWFFKGNQCWKMNDDILTVYSGYPKDISKQWPGLPDNIDAAYHSEFFQETYFFKDTEYWVVDQRKAPYQAYPGGKINQKWKGVCSEKY